MKTPRTRREFLGEVGRGMLVAAVGCDVACDLGLASASDEASTLSFGPLDPLVALMQETAPGRLLPALAERLRSGTNLRQLVAAAALANARTFGGEDYVGFHTMMALAPAMHMAEELPPAAQPLPVFKCFYQKTARSPEEAFNDLLFAVQDNTEVHRVVLPYRAWDLLGLIGAEQAHALLRQSVRYCVKAESWQHSASWDEPRTLLPKMLEEHRLLGRTPGDRRAEDGWVEQMSQTLFRST